MYDLKDHVALITGANHGIGAETAKRLAACGASVVLSYLRTCDPDDFPEAYRRNRASGPEAAIAAIRHRGGRAAAGSPRPRTTRCSPSMPGAAR